MALPSSTLEKIQTKVLVLGRLSGLSVFVAIALALLFNLNFSAPAKAECPTLDFNNFTKNNFQKYYTSKNLCDLESIYRAQTNVSQQALAKKSDSLDVAIFVGQSNLAGRGSDALSQNADFYRSYQMIFNGNNVRGIVKLTQANELHKTIIPSFAKSYYQQTGRPLAIINQAKPDKNIDCYAKDQDCFKELISKIASVNKYLRARNLKVNKTFIVWMGGELEISDTGYYAKFLKTVQALYQANHNIAKNFIIRVPHRFRNNTDNYRIIHDQTALANRFASIVLASTKTTDLAWISDGPSLPSPAISREDTDNKFKTVLFNQKALDIIGADAGHNAALYYNTNQEAWLKDEAFRIDNLAFYQTGYKAAPTLTPKQSYFLISRAHKFIEQGNAQNVLQYGILGPHQSLNLQLVPVNLVKMNIKGEDKVVMWFYNETAGGKFRFVNDPVDILANKINNKREYIVMSCATLASFQYRYTFGLDFRVNKYAYAASDTRKQKPIPVMINVKTPAGGQQRVHMKVAWDSDKFIDNLPIKTYDGQRRVSTFRTILDLYKPMANGKGSYRYSELMKPAYLDKLQVGDIIVSKNYGRRLDLGAVYGHVMIYAGKTPSGRPLLIHSSGQPRYHIAWKASQRGKTMGYSYLDDPILNHVGQDPMWQRLTVLRLNDQVLDPNFITNAYEVNFSKLADNREGFIFKPVFEKEITAPIAVSTPSIPQRNLSNASTILAPNIINDQPNVSLPIEVANIDNPENKPTIEGDIPLPAPELPVIISRQAIEDSLAAANDDRSVDEFVTASASDDGNLLGEGGDLVYDETDQSNQSAKQPVWKLISLIATGVVLISGLSFLIIKYLKSKKLSRY